MRDAGARRRPRRLLGRLPQRRPRHEDRAGRALRHARRRLPQRRLHSLEGAAARRRGDRGSRARERCRRELRRAQDRHRCAAQAQGEGRRQADDGPDRHGQGAQSRSRARLRPLPRRQPPRSRTDHGRRPGKDRREEGRQVSAVHHRRRFASRSSAVPSGRSAHRRFHRRAGTQAGAAENARHRRRHHRPRNGHRLLDARREGRCGRDARRPDAGSGPRRRQGLGEAERAPLRQDHAEDEDHCGRGEGRWLVGDVRGRESAKRGPALRPDPAGRRPQPERQEDRRGQGRRAGERARLHPGRQPDAHQRAAHLRDRRHRRQSHARPQGGARGARRRRSGGGAEGAFRRQRDPGRGLHASGDRVGGPRRG